MAKVCKTRESVIGIDIGSVSFSMVQLDLTGNILNQFYQFHKGNISGTFADAINGELPEWFTYSPNL